MSHYLQFSKNIFSQNGEDGIIEQLFSDLKIQDGLLVEFGAWDGIYLSNIYNLINKNKSFNAIFIESEGSKIPQLNKLRSNNIECVHNYVSPNKNDTNSIENILKRSKFNKNLDISLMAIDVDSCDYYIFESITEYLPKVIMIETNYDYNYNQDFISYDKGCSLKSLNTLAIQKGYTLICHTLNAFFVKNEYIDMLPKFDKDIKSIYLSLAEILEQQKINDIGTKVNQLYYTTQEYNKRLSLERNKY